MRGLRASVGGEIEFRCRLVQIGSDWCGFLAGGSCVGSWTIFCARRGQKEASHRPKAVFTGTFWISKRPKAVPKASQARLRDTPIENQKSKIKNQKSLSRATAGRSFACPCVNSENRHWPGCRRLCIVFRSSSGVTLVWTCVLTRRAPNNAPQAAREGLAPEPRR